MNVCFFGNKSPFKIRFAQILHHIITSTYSKSLLINDASISKSDAIYKMCPSLNILDVSSIANETVLNLAVDMSHKCNIVLFSTPLLTNANIEFLLAILDPSQLLFILNFDVATENLNLPGELVASLNKCLKKNQRIFVFPRVYFNEEISNVKMSDFSLEFQNIIDNFFNEWNLCGQLLSQPRFLETLQKSVNVMRHFSRTSCSEVRIKLVKKYIEDLENQNEDVLQNSDVYLKHHSNRVREINTEYYRELLYANADDVSYENKLMNTQIEYARIVTQDFYHPDKNLGELGHQINSLCAAVRSSLKLNEISLKQLQTLETICQSISPTIDLLQNAINRNCQDTIGVTVSTSHIYEISSGKVKEYEALLKKQRKQALISTIILTIGIAVSAYGLYVAYQAGGMQMIATKIGKEILKEVILLPLPELMKTFARPFLGNLGASDVLEIKSVDVSKMPSAYDSINTSRSILPEFKFDFKELQKIEPRKCGIGDYWNTFVEGYYKNDEYTKLGHDLSLETAGSFDTKIENIGVPALFEALPRLDNAYDAVKNHITECRN